jgi:saccharopine dehydrogenase (NADP+, L-glutamate forming)
MRTLDAPVKKAGITVLNVVGVDPGIDHIYTIKKIHEIHAGEGEGKGVS